MYVGSILTTLLAIQALGGEGHAPAGFILAIAMWLWFTVLFANFAEALAEGRSKAQAASLRGLKRETWAKKLLEPHYGGKWQLVQGKVTFVSSVWPLRRYFTTTSSPGFFWRSRYV